MRGTRAIVMGLGRFGGGVGVTRWLLSQGADVTVTDLAPQADLQDSIALLPASDRLHLACGGHEERMFRDADLVIANPAVPRPWENQYLQAAWGGGAVVTTEIGLLVSRLDRRRVIGVSGSAGKSTTAAMIHHGLAATGCATHLGGNIGGSLLEKLDVIGDDIVVIELSSAMLWWLSVQGAMQWSPGVAVLTNVAPNHLDWHGSLAHYEQCKQAIFAHQTKDDTAIIDATGGAIDLQIPGDHNRRNAGQAIAAVVAMGGDRDAAAEALKSWAGLPHRLELVCERDGLKFYNDSKSTTPEATAVAVRSFSDASKLHIVVGGYDKQIDLSLLAEVTSSVSGVYAIGETGASMVGAVQCGDLETAVREATSRMVEGDTLLLSPGCASWDQFANYEERGDAFRRFVSEVRPPVR